MVSGMAYIRPKLGLHHVERLPSLGFAGAEAQGNQLGLAADDAL